MVQLDEFKTEEIKIEKPKSFFQKIVQLLHHKRLIFIIGLICLIGIVGFFLFKAGFTLNKIFGPRSEYLQLIKKAPIKDPDRINILLLGLRGENDPYGGLLTDLIMILSLKKDTGQVALISIPRDLYIQIPSINQQERINYAYAFGRQKAGETGGILYGKAVVSDVTNLYLDYAIAVDFIAFEKITDIFGGITVYLDKSFKEESQFAGEFIIDLPAGENTMNGKTALYYVRSRYSTSDFDRARRQQEILLAIKNKAFSVGVLLNPVKLYNLLDSLGSHIRTDMTIDGFTELINLYPRLDFKNVKKKVFDTSSEGLLYSGQSSSGAYILLPVGDNFDKIQEVSKKIFE